MSNKWYSGCGAAVLFVIFLAGGAFASPLEAGVAVGNITPDTEKLHVPLGGYGERMNKPALGVHDNTLAKALVLRQGDKKFALVTIDILGIVRPLRDEVLKRIVDTGITSDNLMMAASHTHASVEMNALHSGNTFNIPNLGIFDQKLLDFTADRIAEAIVQANSKFVPIRVGIASKTVEGLNRNRRGDEITDKELTVVRIDTDDGGPFAVFVNFTAHPTYVGPEVMYISAEWPGYLQREVEAFMPGATCMYSNGAEGDVAPAGGQGPSPYARAEDHGRKLAVQVLDLAKSIQTAADVEFDYSMTILKLPKRTVPPALLQEAGPEYGLDESNVGALIDAMSPKSSYCGVLKLGELLAVSIPGEMFTKLGLEIKNTLKSKGATHPIIVGLGNEWISYIMPPEEFTQGGYEPGVSFYGEQLGPRMVKQAISAGEKMFKKH